MTRLPAVTLTRIIPAPPRNVFEAWLDPGVLARFMCPAEGTTVSRVDVAPHVGGAFSIVMRVGTRDLPHTGEYLEIERYERLVFTWLSWHAGPGSRVTLRFEPTADGQTKLTLEHVGLVDELARGRHETGWTGILEALAVVCSRSPSET